MYNTNDALQGVSCDHTKRLYINVIYLNCQLRQYKIMCSKNSLPTHLYSWQSSDKN